MTATGVQFTAFLNMISDRRLSLPSMDGNGSDTHGNKFEYLEYLFFCFLSLSTFHDENGSNVHENGFGYLRYLFFCFLTVSIPTSEV